MKKIIRNKNKGILFTVFGVSGSGKTAIAKKIKKRISYLYGPTIEVSGDDMRKTFKLNKFSQKERKKNLPLYNRFKKLITDKKINLIFSIMGLYDKARNWNRKNIENYVEIYVEANMKKIMSQKRLETHLKRKRNIVGFDIKAELPKKPHVKVINNFDQDLEKISEEVLKKIKKIIKVPSR